MLGEKGKNSFQIKIGIKGTLPTVGTELSG